MNTPIFKSRFKKRVISLGILALLSMGAQAQQGTGYPPAAGATAPAGGGISNEKSFPAIASGKWTGPRLPDGQPNVQGHWSNTIANHNNFTDPQGGIIGGTPPKTKRSERAPSRISDPADGLVPFQPWAAEKVKEFQANFNNPIKPEYVEPLARCAPAGVIKSFYWHGYEIRQFPGYVVILFNSGTRVIQISDKPHLPENIKLWMGDSRGHWEGNTLVVDVANNNGKALFGRSGEFHGENAKITERYIFDNSNKRYNYVATITDPEVYTRPFTVTIPARRYTAEEKKSGWHYEAQLANHDGKQLIAERDERICTENNGGFGNPATGGRR
jgi:hypothetical protein